MRLHRALHLPPAGRPAPFGQRACEACPAATRAAKGSIATATAAARQSHTPAECLPAGNGAWPEQPAAPLPTAPLPTSARETAPTPNAPISPENVPTPGRSRPINVSLGTNELGSVEPVSLAPAAPTVPEFKPRKPRTVSSASDLLPPPADAPLEARGPLSPGIGAGAADNLLPPSADDGLLPPAAAAGAMASEPVPLPSIDFPGGGPALPTTDAAPAVSMLAVKDQRKNKVLRVDGEDIVLRQLTPEERARRRFRWNVFLFGACMAIFGLVVWWGLRK